MEKDKKEERRIERERSKNEGTRGREEIRRKKKKNAFHNNFLCSIQSKKQCNNFSKTYKLLSPKILSLNLLSIYVRLCAYIHVCVQRLHTQARLEMGYAYMCRCVIQAYTYLWILTADNLWAKKLCLKNHSLIFLH